MWGARDDRAGAGESVESKSWLIVLEVLSNKRQRSLSDCLLSSQDSKCLRTSEVLKCYKKYRPPPH